MPFASNRRHQRARISSTRWRRISAFASHTCTLSRSSDDAVKHIFNTTYVILPSTHERKSIEHRDREREIFHSKARRQIQMPGRTIGIPTMTRTYKLNCHRIRSGLSLSRLVRIGVRPSTEPTHRSIKAQRITHARFFFR